MDRCEPDAVCDGVVSDGCSGRGVGGMIYVGYACALFSLVTFLSTGLQVDQDIRHHVMTRAQLWAIIAILIWGMK